MATILVTQAQFEDCYSALHQIGNIPDISITKEVARNLKENKAMSKIVLENMEVLRQKHALVHPDGRFIPGDKGQIQWKDQKAFDAEYKEMENGQVEMFVLEIPMARHPKATWDKIPANLISQLLDVFIIEDIRLKAVK